MSISQLALTIVLFGGGAFMMGQAIAEIWRPWWQILPYGALLALGNEFLGFALFGGPFIVDSLVSKNSQPLSAATLVYLFDAGVIITIALIAYRLTLARKMAAQYPWLYERAGLFGWREKNPAKLSG
jgi:hypothetical protein